MKKRFYNILVYYILVSGMIFIFPLFGQEEGLTIQGGDFSLTISGQASVEIIHARPPTVSRNFVMYLKPQPAQNRPIYTITAQSTALGVSVEI